MIIITFFFLLYIIGFIRKNFTDAIGILVVQTNKQKERWKERKAKSVQQFYFKNL